jgi:hypothetical protein
MQLSSTPSILLRQHQSALTFRGQRPGAPAILICMRILWNAAGFVCIAVALHDVFHTLFHPAGRGAMSDWLAGFVWKIVRALSHNKRERITLAGPFAILTIIGIWVALIVFGFAFIYRPYMAGQFTVAAGLDPAKHRSFLDALNVSIGGLMTLSGDILTKSRVLRLLIGSEAIIGFGLLTASVSWLLSIYPVLERRRTVGHELTLLHNAESRSGIRIIELPSDEAQEILWGLAAEISSLRNDLTQFPITYYFHSGDEHSGLAGALPYVADLAENASRPQMSPSVRMAGIALGGAIHDYLEYVAETFLDMPLDDKRAIMRRYADEHLFRPMRAPVPLRRAG